ncbi:autotransporter outer membrane beta-barrel domain-containing protein [Flavobacterium gilvum]|uniref:Uncharacterized protein n=1 Tax=Flavobacterium gilvum TaxID=1492737 RepID=A0AAC9I7A3_9FLAO|nr:hypothetical protein [Flavobacterium gilvum]AOW10383.1 hypothetical protein EM308_13200 [Flavobacterium gilvum]KFC60249.1 hypothetical protein FEM08_09500 [Flavobacterium gilvum]
MMNKIIIILLLFSLSFSSFAQKKVRVINNKGTVTYVDPSKWFEVAGNLYNKNGNVAIGLDTLTTPTARLVISNGGSTTLPPLKLQNPFAGSFTDSLLTWNAADGEVRRMHINKLLNNTWKVTGNAGTNPGNNFLGTTDANDLVIKTNNTEKMRVTSVGNIGVGTATPSTKLEVNSGTTDVSGLRFSQLKSTSPAPVTYNSKVLTVNATGDVGLTTVPGTESIVDFSVNVDPNVAGTTFSPDIQKDRDIVYLSTIDYSSWTWNGVAYVAYSPTSTAWLQGGNIVSFMKPLGTKNDYDLPIVTNSMERMRITSTGKVGIGNTYPYAALDVNGNIYTSLHLSLNEHDAAEKGSRFIGHKSGNSGDGFAGMEMQVLGTAEGASGNNVSRIHFNTWGNSISASRRVMTINEYGNVGMGTTTPAAKLEVNSGTTDVSGLRITNLKNTTVVTADAKAIGVNANGDVVTVDAAANAWSLTGNAGTTTGTNFIGTTDANELMVKTNNVERMKVLSGTTVNTTQIGVATANPAFTTPANTGATIPTLGVDGTVNATNYTSPVQIVIGGAWDLSKGGNAKWTLAAGANTLTLTNMKPGMYGTIIVTNTGTSTIAFGGGTNKVINGGSGVVTLTPLAGAVDLLSFFYDGTTFWWTIGNNYN